MKDLERRYGWGGDVRIDPDVSTKIRGLAIVFNSQSVDLGGFREIIDPRAVDRTIAGSEPVFALVDHDSGKVIGSTRAGTLTLRKTARGLEVAIDPPNTTAARDVLELVRRGDVGGMSFGFRTVRDEWDHDDVRNPIRTVLDMTIHEVSIVAMPAYQATDVDVAKRSLADADRARAKGQLEWLQRRARTQRARLL